MQEDHEFYKKWTVRHLKKKHHCHNFNHFTQTHSSMDKSSDSDHCDRGHPVFSEHDNLKG